MKIYQKVLGVLLPVALAFNLAACGGASASVAASTSAASSEAASVAASSSAETTQAAAEEPVAVEIDKDAFDALVASIAPASDDEIAASEWASAVKKAGVLRVGGTRTSFLFSQLDEADNSLRGFDAGLYQLLAQYILGDSNAYELTQVTSATREELLKSGEVDAVFATYSITPARQEVISFAGPYFTSQSAVLVRADNTEITGIDSLAGKLVAVQAGSTGASIVETYAPNATIQEFSDDTEARTALELGRVDAYVTDYTLLLNAIVKNPGTYKIAGDVFGNVDPYGIGLPLDSDGVEFVNEFLQKIEADGTWEELWKITLGDRTGITEVPAAPAIG
jgi:glutamate transport system substrate-binding protein